MELSDYQRTRARQVCNLIGAHQNGTPCTDEKTPCDNQTCYVFELLHLGEAAGLDAALKICSETDTIGRAESGILDYRAHTNGEP